MKIDELEELNTKLEEEKRYLNILNIIIILIYILFIS